MGSRALASSQGGALTNTQPGIPLYIYTGADIIVVPNTGSQNSGVAGVEIFKRGNTLHSMLPLQGGRLHPCRHRRTW